MSLDAIDLRILRHLQQDGRMSNQDLAEKVSLSPSACLRRLRLLESEGIIRGYSVELDAERLGVELEAIVHVSLRQDVEGWHEAFIARVRDWPEVVTAYVVTGATNYVLRVRARNLKHYSDFSAAGVTDIRSEIVLQEIKAGADLLDLVNLKS